MTVSRSSDFDREPELFEDRLIPAPPVELVRLDERWRQQNWAVQRRENLHRADGEPTWIQNADYPACTGCTRTMSAADQIAAVGDLWNAEGICYLLVRPVRHQRRRLPADLTPSRPPASGPAP